MRLHSWTLPTLLVGLLGCGAVETPPAEGSPGVRRDAGAVSRSDDDADDDDEATDDDDDESATTTTKRDAGTRARDAGTSDADQAPEGCGQANFRTQPLLPDMLIVLDRSGSMRSGIGAVDRWAPSVAAVKSLTTTFQQQVAFGLMTFPYANEQCGPGRIQVPIAMNTATQIGQILDRSDPQGGTPTGDTLHVALESFLASSPGGDMASPPRYVLLVTDGQPTCPASRGSSSNATDLELDKKLTIEALDQLAAENIKTFVVGYDAELDPLLAAALTEFAKHGKTERYYPVQDEKTLVQAFTTISSEIVSCTFSFDKAVEDPRYLRVEFDGELLLMNTPNGWTIEGQSVTLQGASCEKLQGRASHRVEMKLDCVPVVAI